ncbi:MAG: DUF1835 domain-containing protein [Bacteroidota bacterium]|nr:DUF1835 domain-containing protein [Bacteroidota bacterium]MDP4217822.1 DUF1835 domain-containing protein [Bacteroidota bacterium]MDP4247495.1 DUF1835 domain-containing protein [Bacteroidota bacterium]MDP4256584.1 DUF1835 domain-containing protein [Bacteroidota bacterium]MDP4260098.1 DUF1835 domain-containing protein [Bacteroidota bacterium]
MIHIVFQQSDIEALRSAFALDPSFKGELIQIEDDYAVGPLAGIYSPEGIEARRQWWRGILAGGDYDGLVDKGRTAGRDPGAPADDNATVAALTERLREDPDEKVWIWAAQNQHDVCGYYWLMSQLREFQGRIFILYLNNLPFINEKGQLFYPVNLFNIPPREFLKARKLARPITAAEFEVDPDEWNKLCQENKGVRQLEGGKKLSQHDYDYYDAELKKFLTGDWVKASKLIHACLSKAKQITGDAYLLWRIKTLVAAGEIDAQGELRGMKDFEIKAKISELQA